MTELPTGQSPNGAPPEDAELPGEGADEQAPDVQLSIEGDADLSLTTVGGRRPDQSVLVMRGGEIKVAGGMKKGDRVRITFEGPIAEAHFIDIRDSKTGDVVGTKRKHVLKPDTIERQPLGE